MGKVIRLTENDLNKIVKRVIQEQRVDPRFKFVDELILQDSEKHREKGITSWYKDDKEVMAYDQNNGTMYFRYEIADTIETFLALERSERRDFLESWLEYRGYHRVHPWVEVVPGDLF
jgi:hypothetical protein